MIQIPTRALLYVVIWLVFPATGYFSGWLVGQSREPAVAAFLPLFFAVAGALSYGLFDRRVRTGEFFELLAKRVDKPTAAKVQKAVQSDVDGSLFLPTFWASGVLVFVVTCWWGIEHGIDKRIDRYPDLLTFVRSQGIEVSSGRPTPAEWSDDVPEAEAPMPRAPMADPSAHVRRGLHQLASLEQPFAQATLSHSEFV